MMLPVSLVSVALVPFAPMLPTLRVPDSRIVIEPDPVTPPAVPLVEALTRPKLLPVLLIVIAAPLVRNDASFSERSDVPDCWVMVPELPPPHSGGEGQAGCAEVAEHEVPSVG